MGYLSIVKSLCISPSSVIEKHNVRFRKIKLLIKVFTSVILINTANAADYPALPQIFIQTDYNLPVGGQIISVSTNAAFQSALNTSNLSDIIEMQAGIIFTGPFYL